jgi:hypothetical protein
MWLTQSQECHWWLPYKGLVLFSERPTKLFVNSKGQLHKDGAMAIEYSDGWGICALNGVRMPDEHVLTSAEKIDAKIVIKETNAEVRRELIRKIGVERFIQSAGAKVLSKQDDYELLSVKLSREIPDARFLKMLNPSVGVWHVEGVHPECGTVQAALNWRAGNIKEQWSPEVLT